MTFWLICAFMLGGCAGFVACFLLVAAARADEDIHVAKKYRGL